MELLTGSKKVEMMNEETLQQANLESTPDPQFYV